MKNLKKRMMDKEYRTFRLRVWIVASISVGIVVETIWEVNPSYDTGASFVIGIILGVGGIWLLYWMIRRKYERDKTSQ